MLKPTVTNVRVHTTKRIAYVAGVGFQLSHKSTVEYRRATNGAKPKHVQREMVSALSIK